MLDVPEKINVNHKIDAKDWTIKVSLYDAEKKTLCGIPVAGVIGAGIFIAVLTIISRRRKNND